MASLYAGRLRVAVIRRVEVMFSVCRRQNITSNPREAGRGEGRTPAGVRPSLRRGAVGQRPVDAVGRAGEARVGLEVGHQVLEVLDATEQVGAALEGA